MSRMIIPNEELRMLCIKNDWFTCGTCRQYDKLFYANSQGASLEEIATIIWLCSDDDDDDDDDDHCRRDIKAQLEDVMSKKEI